MFAAAEPGSFELSLTNRRAAEALNDPGSVLDVGCGGGAAAFAVTPPATQIIGTDRQPDMLELFAATARERGIPATVHAGSWPGVASRMPRADVVVCHNVLYNISNLLAFVAALDAKARLRVVIEITPNHPRASRRRLWQHFWDLKLPHEPTAADAADAIAQAGLDPVVEHFEQSKDGFSPERAALAASHVCRQLCLADERTPEVAALLADTEFPRERVAIWWDKP